MSSYITRYCESHGEWEQDVDDPYEECPECVEKGIAPSQLEKLEKDALKQEIESQRKDKEYLLALCEERRLAEKEWKRRASLMYRDMSSPAVDDGRPSEWEWFLEEHPEAEEWFEEE